MNASDVASFNTIFSKQRETACSLDFRIPVNVFVTKSESQCRQLQKFKCTVLRIKRLMF
jgi:hypothetical protein